MSGIGSTVSTVVTNFLWLFGYPTPEEIAADTKKLREDAKLTDAALKAFEAHPQKAHANVE